MSLDAEFVQAEYSRTITRLMFDNPLFGLTLKRLKVTYSEREPIAATTPRKIMLGDEFFNLEIKDREFVLVHESMHVLSMHPERGKQMAKAHANVFPPIVYEIANLVEDAKINKSIITELPCSQELESNSYFPSSLYNDYGIDESELNLYSTEEIVAKILKKEILTAQTPTSGKSSCGGVKSDEQTEDNNGGSGTADETSSKKDDGTGGGNPEEVTLNEGIEELQTASTEDLAKVKKNITAEAVIVAKSIGVDAGNFERMFKEIYESAVNWKKVLRMVLNSMENDDIRRIWSRVNKKNELLPSSRGIGYSRVWLLLDVSGSIDITTINRWFSEVYSIMRLKRKMVIVGWDAKVQEVVEVKRKSDISKVMIHGGGGTIIKDALDYTFKNKKEGDEIVVLSDFAIMDVFNEKVVKMLSKCINFTTWTPPERLAVGKVKATKIKIK